MLPWRTRSWRCWCTSGAGPGDFLSYLYVLRGALLCLCRTPAESHAHWDQDGQRCDASSDKTSGQYASLLICLEGFNISWAFCSAAEAVLARADAALPGCASPALAAARLSIGHARALAHGDTGKVGCSKIDASERPASA